MTILLYIFFILLGIWVFWLILATGSVFFGWLERRREDKKKQS